MARRDATAESRQHGLAPLGMGVDLVMSWVNAKDPKELYDQVPFNRLAQRRDVGHLAVFLASDRASHISGQVIFLDDGVGPSSLKYVVGKRR